MEFRSQRFRDVRGNSSKNREEQSRSSKQRRPDIERSSFRSAAGGPPSKLSESSRDGSESRRPNEGKAFSDDSKLSSLVRRILREDDRERRLNAVHQLHDFLLISENNAVVLKSAENLLNAINDVFYERTSKEIKHEMAICLGILGHILSIESEKFFVWLFPKISSSNHTDETKILLLTSLAEAIKQDVSGDNLGQFMPMIMAKCQAILENADVSELLLSIVDVIMLIAKAHPSCFGRHFRDTVDILVGWHIDTTQKESLTEFTSQALISFQQFWSSELSFSFNLLGQFLEDMEGYVEELVLVVSDNRLLSESESDFMAIDEYISKVYALLRVFTTVVKSIWNGPLVDIQYFLDIFYRLAKCVSDVLDSWYDERMLIYANACLCVILDKLSGMSLEIDSTTLLHFLTTQILSKNILTDQYVISILNIITKVIDALNVRLPQSFISQLLGVQSIVPGLCSSSEPQVVSNVMLLYKSIMALKSVPLLEEGYRLVLSNLERAYNTLFKDIRSDVECSLVDSNPLIGLEYNAESAEVVIIFCICVLTEIGNAKSNLIGMWVLSPSIFILFSQRLLPLDTGIMDNYPSIHYAILQALYSHCSRHSHFILSSSLLNQNLPVEGSLLATGGPANNSNHFTLILSLLADLHRCPLTPFDSRCLCLKWTLEVTRTLQTSKTVYRSKEFLQLIAAVILTGYNPQREITRFACECLLVFLRNATRCPSIILEKCKELCCIRLCDSDNAVRHIYLELLRLLPLNVASRTNCSLMIDSGDSGLSFALDDGHAVAYYQACRNHMARPATGNFSTMKFTWIMDAILNGDSQRQKGSSWLERQFYSCQRCEKEPGMKEETEDLLSLLIDRNERLLWFWGTWEAAQFCVQSKLRTPLGKPPETFTAIESVLKTHTAELRSHDCSDKNVTTGVKSSAEQRAVFNARLLLQFMENLEKHIYNASEGCAVAMAPSPKVVRTFFRTNRSTCHDWLSRVRPCVMQIAGRCDEPGMVVRHAFELLNDFKDGHIQSGEFESVILMTAEALCMLRSPEAIQGLLVFSRELTGRKMNWIRAAADMASGKFESAILGFRLCLRSYMTMDSLFEDAKDTPSPASSPFASPAHAVGIRNGGSQKVTLLTKHQDLSPNSSHEANVVSFMVRQVCEGYMKLDSWDEAVKWQNSVTQYYTEHAGSPLQKAFNIGMDSAYLRALASFNEHDFESVEQRLEELPSLSLSHLSSSTENKDEVEMTWDLVNSVKKSKEFFVQAVTLLLSRDSKSEMENVLNLLSKSQLLSENVLRVSATPRPTRMDRDAVIQLFRSTLLTDQLNPDKKPENWLWPLGEDLSFDSFEHDVSDSLLALEQMKLQQLIQSRLYPDLKYDFTDQLSRLRLAAINLARRHGNFNLGSRLLVEQMSSLGLCESSSDCGANSDDSLLNAFAKMNISQNDDNPDQLWLKLKIEREGAKMLYSKSLTHNAIETLCTSIISTFGGMQSASALQQKQTSTATVTELNSRSLVTLVKWLQTDTKYMSQVTTQLQQLKQNEDADVLMVVKNLKILLANAPATSIASSTWESRFADHPDSDLLVEKLLHLSTVQCPMLAKSWFALAGWCYKWARKEVDNAVHGSVELSTDDKAKIVALLPPGTSLEETDSVLSILSHTHTGGVTSEEDISENDQTRYDDGADTLRKQLLVNCLSLQMATPACLDSLVAIWRSVMDRVYHYYKLSAKSYFTFLQLNGQVGSEINMDGNITATLRLLRLLVKHAWELRDTLEDGLAHSPTAPWKGIIPQLFSRLNHPEPYVRQSVSDLLCRVGKDAPHLVVYPAVVGYSSGKDIVKEESNRDGLLNEYLSESETESDTLDVDAEDLTSQDEDERNVNLIQNCFAAILESLSANNPRMISEVELLVSELRRITLLWDELWLGTLTQIYPDVIRRLKQLENEVRKVQDNRTLSPDEAKAIILKKHITVLKPTLCTLERLQEVTNQTQETPHEKWFQETYGKQIECAFEALRNPSNPRNPNSSWQPFKQLHQSLQQRAQKRTGQVLNMNEISTRLTGLKHTAIAMPGLSSTNQVVTIDSIHNTIQILPTKTKPKKLIFIGSNGLRYPYLFKGLEDLHLDERIMQFLSIVNNMFVKGNSVQGKQYRARHYSVTPLGARSGLIQWVDGATPMFSLYKRWQQRESVAQQNKQQPNGAPIPPQIPRPSELFNNKLHPLLKEKGITVENRKDWPLSMLRKVLDELISETPKDLLSKELWCSSSTSSEWWLVTQSYARSTAVMSMIGYIIGLGDRHLDNVLVDLTTGEVVHIDYNICFEKGKSLRVPERVPFRMTQNIQHALGLTGVEGTFRIACEHVIKTMRRGRETLLTLLEAFVYDPLVDWTVGNEWGYTGAFYGGNHSLLKSMAGRQSKREMEREITVNMFSIRVAEMKVLWLNNRAEFLSTISKLHDSVKKLLSIRLEQKESDLKIEKLESQLDYLQKALASNEDHSIHDLSERYHDYAAAKSTNLEVMRMIEEKMNECEHFNKSHEHALNVVRSNQLQQMGLELNKLSAVNSITGFASVTEFLQGAGQGSLVTQRDQSCQEFQTSMMHHRNYVRNCLDVLHKYSKIVAHYPRSFEKTNRSSRWKHWLQDLICDFTSESVEAIEKEMNSIYSSGPYPQAPNVSETEQHLQNVAAQINVRLCQLVELRHNLSSELTENLLSQVQSYNSMVHNFMQERGLLSTMCMTSVLVLDLCSVANSFLDMEKAFHATGGHFDEYQLKSVDGVWLLDRLLNKTSNALQLLQLLNYSSSMESMKGEDSRKIESAIFSTHNLYLSLQDMYCNFHNVIIPEAMAAFQAHEPTILSMLSDLDNLVTSLGMPVETVIDQLETLLMNSKLNADMESDQQLLLTVKKVRLRFEKLYHPMETDRNDRGQLLLVVFAGLFSRIETDFMTFVGAVSVVYQFPDAWKMVDHIFEAQRIVNLDSSDYMLDLLSNLFFVKQLKTMIQFFHQCEYTSAAMLSTTSVKFFDDEILSISIKLFICQFLFHQVVGLPSQVLGCGICIYINTLRLDISAEIELNNVGETVSLDHLCTKAVDLNLKNDVFTAQDFKDAEIIVFAVVEAWQKADLARSLDSSIMMEKTGYQRSQLLLVSYQWMHEDILVNTTGFQSSTLPRRALMSELKKVMQSLMQYGRENLVQVQQRHLQLEKTVAQRLKWAAGANPTLSQTLQQFEDSLDESNAAVESEVNLASEVVKVCKAILHYEAMLTKTTEALQADGNFHQLLIKCKESCLLSKSSGELVTPIEAELVESKFNAGCKVTNEWIESTVNQLKAEICDVQHRIKELCKDIDLAKEVIKSETNGMRTVLISHHKLMSDMRIILKAMAKLEEHDETTALSSSSGIQDYLLMYKTFSQDFTMMLKMIASEETTETSFKEIETMIHSFKEQIARIYDDLLNMAPPLMPVESRELQSAEELDTDSTSTQVLDKSGHFPPMPGKSLAPSSSSVASHKFDSSTTDSLMLGIGTRTAQQAVKPAGMASTSKDKVTRDPVTGKALQERNTYAVGVWRKIKLKLDGKDVDTNKRHQVAEQVDYVIKEATNLDNLAVLYEGWTPWV